MKTRSNLAEFSEEGYGLKGAVLSMMRRRRNLSYKMPHTTAETLSVPPSKDMMKIDLGPESGNEISEVSLSADTTRR